MIDEKKLIEDIFQHEQVLKMETDIQLAFANGYKQRDAEIRNIIEKQPQADWIPCERKLPPQPKENPFYENKPLQVYLVSVKNCEEPFRAFWNGKVFTDGWSKLNVEAWMELPQPYKKDHLGEATGMVEKPMTNADRIRNMTDEELAKFLGKTVYYCRGRQESKYCDECPLLECGACNEIVIKRWLQAEVKEGNSDDT